MKINHAVRGTKRRNTERYIWTQDFSYNDETAASCCIPVLASKHFSTFSAAKHSHMQPFFLFLSHSNSFFSLLKQPWCLECGLLGLKKKQGDGKQKCTKLLANIFCFIWFFSCSRIHICPYQEDYEDYFCLCHYQSSSSSWITVFPLFWSFLCNFLKIPEIIMSICCWEVVTLLVLGKWETRISKDKWHQKYLHK